MGVCDSKPLDDDEKVPPALAGVLVKMGPCFCLEPFLRFEDDLSRLETEKNECCGKEHLLSYSLVFFGVAGGLGKDSFLHFILEMLDRFSSVCCSMLLSSGEMMVPCRETVLCLLCRLSGLLCFINLFSSFEGGYFSCKYS